MKDINIFLRFLNDLARKFVISTQVYNPIRRPCCLASSIGRKDDARWTNSTVHSSVTNEQVEGGSRC